MASITVLVDNKSNKSIDDALRLLIIIIILLLLFFVVVALHWAPSTVGEALWSEYIPDALEDEEEIYLRENDNLVDESDALSFSDMFDALSTIYNEEHCAAENLSMLVWKVTYFYFFLQILHKYTVLFSSP